MSEVYEIKWQRVGERRAWEDRKATTQVVMDESEIVIYWAYIMFEDNTIDEVRYNRQGSTQGHYITRQMATRIANEQRELFTGMDKQRVDMLASVLVNTVETAAMDYWITKMKYDFREDEEDNIVDAWARFTVWSEDENDGRKFFITPFTIEKGIRTIVDDPNFQVRKDIWQSIAWADKHPADADIDAEMGDVIVQAALFGEIVYG
jgi:hypothetical protein